MNRVHRATQALASIKNAQAAGFENLTVDLIYGAPTTSNEQWAANLQQVFDLEVPHLSCYCLTVEEKTALAHLIKKGKAQPVNEEQAIGQFEFLVKQTAAEGYQHYEISNFAKPGWYSRHNSNYWQGKKYLGIGPSAHSFDGPSRQWNVANNARYIRSLAEGKIPFEKEILTSAQRYDEYVMTHLRTMWGCDLKKIRELGYEEHFLKNTEPYIRQAIIKRSDELFLLTTKGMLLADGVASDLFADE